jgi:D-sorbitol dehydrogenase (acceptor)
MSRRTLLSAALTLAAAALTGTRGLGRANETASAELDVFMDVSRRLTGKPSLEARLGARIHAALAKADPDVLGSVASLSAALTSGEGSVAALLTRASPRDRAVAQRILRGWYLGVVGDDAGATCVAYETVLGYQAVADKVVLQTFCRGRPGYWVPDPR